VRRALARERALRQNGCLTEACSCRFAATTAHPSRGAALTSIYARRDGVVEGVDRRLRRVRRGDGCYVRRAFNRAPTA
jgi:hypothetical protein